MKNKKEFTISLLMTEIAKKVDEAQKAKREPTKILLSMDHYEIVRFDRFMDEKKENNLTILDLEVLIVMKPRKTLKDFVEVI